ncbi:MAG TPA: bacterial transcriptional activator domain-containing protein [Aggregatilineaceae bacterium]|nr:bacterial transcriptional activator domain-containing protein [Aggregatilineaceae bacterium]
MNTQDSFSYASEQLRSLPAHVTLLILHPDFHGQHRLFAPVLADLDTTTIFLTVPSPNYPFEAFLADLRDALQAQLNVEPPKLPKSAEDAASTIARFLKPYGRVTLIIDAYDSTQRDEAAPFIAALARQIPDGSRIMLSARELPMDLLEHEELQGRIALLPTNADKMMLDYAQSGRKTVLEVRALGPGRVLINGRLVEHWDGVLPRTLFFYFVDRGMTTRDEIFQTFWPNLSTREATNVFHVTKRKISEILGTDLTVYWSGFYRISPELDLHYDVVKFAESVQNAAVAPDEEAIAMLQTAIELYHGPFLSTMDQTWVLDRRGELAMTYAEALTGLARIYKTHDVKVNALGYYLRAAATSPQREDLARSIMELYRELERPRAALETYDRLERELKTTLNVSPSPQTMELASIIRKSL